MILIEVMGGLGNQLQQYALFRKMKYLGKEAKLDLSWFADQKRQENVLARRRLELSRFPGLWMEVCTDRERSALLGNDSGWKRRLKSAFGVKGPRFYETGMYHPEIFSFTDRYLTGFWACEKYYADLLPLLRREIVFPGFNSADPGDSFAGMKSENSENSVNSENSGNSGNKKNDTRKENNNKNRQIMEEMRREMSVSLHVRRGDYLDPQNAALFGGICTEAYYEGAIRYLSERYPEAHFYVFSDDSEYVREKYAGERYTVVDWNRGDDSIYDMQLMSCCKHNICANSTFSFWGARLNPNSDRIAIRPARHKNGQPADAALLHELWEGWVIADEAGRIL